MNNQELIEKIENLNKLYGEKHYVAIDDVLNLASQLDDPEKGYAEQSPQYLKNILARLRELPLHDREIWLKAIMSEFEQDFSHAKWREGYEPGKIDFVADGADLKEFEEDAKEIANNIEIIGNIYKNPELIE